ncbi:hypothetical protein BRPE64_ACDS09170 [Caballeronia insecticola]|uniref:Uncharacterized protein n=1 Tax=Caballeronia insecticola TaxID=758793 RepID=R4WUS1_9BURK|nr:hypothetical protein BRPE64_ACDS09170 [Caballeronia insecticola]
MRVVGGAAWIGLHVCSRMNRWREPVGGLVLKLIQRPFRQNRAGC